MALLSTVEAAERLRISDRRVRDLIAEKRLPAQKVGRDYVIDEKDLLLVKNRKPGRPRKTHTKKKLSKK